MRKACADAPSAKQRACLFTHRAGTRLERESSEFCTCDDNGTDTMSLEVDYEGDKEGAPCFDLCLLVG